MRLVALSSFLALALFAVQAHAQTASGIIGPVPSWVAPVVVPTPASSAQGDTESLLDDRQVRVESEHSLTYVHRAYAVRSTAGVQSSSELTVDRASDAFITWHFVRRIRAGITDDVLPRLQIKVIQPEAKLQEGIYDGGKREVLFLEDVRVGDVIEFAYTVRDSNALLGNRYAERFWLGRSYPLRRLELRASWPQTRQIAVKATGVAVEQPSLHELRFVRSDLEAYEQESREPKWFEATPYVELSEFGSWSDIVAWALPYYALPVPREVQEKAQSFRVATSRAEQMAAAVRFVQDEVRYLGIEEGVRALVPHPPAEVLARRFGDCKDKAVLLVSLLRALGFDAQPALVNTQWRRAIEHMLPSPGAFDHVIVRAELDGKELWFDATGSYERGPITAPHALPYERALVLRAGESSLRVLEIKPPSEPELEVRERFTLSGQGSATLHVHTTYRGERANDMRARLAHRDHKELEKEYLDFYGRTYGEVSIRAPLGIKDDEGKNTLVVSEHYTLREFWQDDEQSVRAWSIEDFLPLPERSRAKRPFALSHPVRARHIIELYNTGGWEMQSESLAVHNKAFEYTFSSKQLGKSELIQHDFASKADHVAAADLDGYVRDANRARSRLDSSYVTGQKKTSQDSKATGFAMLGIFGGGALLWGLWAGAHRLRLHRRRRRAAKQRQFGPGQAPESAISVADLAKARLMLLGIECCDKPLFRGELVPSEVRYGDGHLTVYRGACAQCERVHSRYFSVQKSEPAKRVS